jgi:glycosyltransferase involved in cell wall biosynthesis
MKIAMVGLKGIPYPAGIENFTEEVGWRLAEMGHEVTVYVRPYVAVGKTYRGMHIRRLPSVDTKHLDALSHTCLASLDLLRADVDIAHYHALGPSVFSILPRARGIATIVQVHGLDWQRGKWGGLAQRCLHAAEYSAMYFPHRTLAVSKNLKTYLENRYNRPVDYVPNAVNSYEYRPPGEITKWGLDKGNYFLFLARLVPEKGCHHLLRAYEEIETDKKLVIAGPASHSEEYAELLRKSASPNVLFTGTVGGTLLEELFSNAFAYILPSEIEGLPHSLLQALSFGKFVLASDIEANVEALGGECGLTFRSKDYRDLRDKLAYLLANPDLTESERCKAKTRVRRCYSWDGVVRRLETIYTQCLERSKG